MHLWVGIENKEQSLLINPKNLYGDSAQPKQKLFVPVIGCLPWGLFTKTKVKICPIKYLLV